MKRKKLRQQRPQAFLGAILGAATSLIGGAINGINARNQAQEEAEAIRQASRENAIAMANQNANNNKLQKESIEFMKSENELNRQLQRDMQFNTQLQGGMLDTEQRIRDSRIQVKRGGKVSRKKLRDAFFYGGDNIPFRVTDGGGVLPLGQTPEGFDLYELIGNDHNHYHKTSRGKYKTGVGIKFGSTGIRSEYTSGGKAGTIVEGEGNQNTNQGEYLLTTPTEAMFISKHSINGFNPVKAINSGMHPIMAYNIQETNKHNRTPKRQMRCGGRVKAWGGTRYPSAYSISGFNNHTTLGNPFGKSNVNYSFDYNRPNFSTPSYVLQPANDGMYVPRFPSIGNITLPNSSTKPKRYLGMSGNMAGALLTSAGNVLGTIASNWGASKGSRILANAAREAYENQASAIAGIRGVDMSILNRKDFRGASIMPVVHNVNPNYNPQLEDVNRQVNDAMHVAKGNTTSSAARYNRLIAANNMGQQMRSKIYAERDNKQLELQRDNATALNQAAIENARLAVEGNKDYMGLALDLAKYNNEIENYKLTEPARLRGEGLLQAAQVRGAYKQMAGQNWGNTLASIGRNVGGAISTDYNMNKQLEIERSGGSLSAQVSNVAIYGTPKEKADYADYIRRILSNPNLTPNQRSQYNTMLNSLV